MKTVYTPEQIADKLNLMSGWTLKEGAIEKQYLFKDFSAALAFLIQIGIEAEKMNHHPEIYNVYHKVVIRLNTHDAKAITNLDFELAEKIDGIFVSAYGRKSEA